MTHRRPAPVSYDEPSARLCLNAVRAKRKAKGREEGAMSDDTGSAGPGGRRSGTRPCRPRQADAVPVATLVGLRATAPQGKGQELAGRVRDEVSRSSFGSSATGKTRALWETCGRSSWPLGQHQHRGMGRGDRLGRPAATSLPAGVGPRSHLVARAPAELTIRAPDRHAHARQLLHGHQIDMPDRFASTDRRTHRHR